MTSPSHGMQTTSLLVLVLVLVAPPCPVAPAGPFAPLARGAGATLHNGPACVGRQRCVRSGLHDSTILVLRGGGVGGSWTPRSIDQQDAAARSWGQEFERFGQAPAPASTLLGPISTPFSSTPPQREGEAEALFRHAFFLTHYRLDFVNARQLLERVLALNPQHVPALTTLVSCPHNIYYQIACNRHMIIWCLCMTGS